MQRDDAWFALRAGKLTASRFADLMARTRTGPSASRANLLSRLAIERLLGTCVETYSNAAMQRGIELEAEAIAAYEDAQLVAVERVDFLLHATLEFVGVSPDGLIGSDGMVEAKCPSAEAKHYEALRYGQHAADYRWQVQGQLWVSGRAWCDVVSYDPRFPEGLRLAIVRVYPDPEDHAALHAACVEAHAEIEEQVAWLRQKAA